MMLVIDIGNTDTLLAIYNKGLFEPSIRIRSKKDEGFLFFEYQILNFFLENDISPQEIEQVVISSVVPELSPIFIDFTENHIKKTPLIISHLTTAGLTIGLDKPEELGTDLLANAVAAYHKYNGACIVADFGTAFTLMAVTNNKIIKGGIIAPGLKTAMSSLTSKTAQLPEVYLQVPENVIGNSTATAISSGILNGYYHLVKGLIKDMKEELGGEVKVIATGGLSSIIPKLKEEFDEIDILHTLKGIQLIGEYYK